MGRQSLLGRGCKMRFHKVAFMPSAKLVCHIKKKLWWRFLRTSRLPQVCKLWLRTSKGMLPARHLAPLIVMTVDYRERQPAGMFAREAPAFFNPSSCEHGLHYDGKPDWHSKVIDVCCLQKVRWRGQDVGMLGMKGRKHRLWLWKRRWSW